MLLMQIMEHVAYATYGQVMEHVEHQIGAQLWKYWVREQQSVHCGAVTSQLYLHWKDCVNVGQMHSCC